MPLHLKLLAFLALPICMTLSLLSGDLPQPSPIQQSSSTSEEPSTASPEDPFIEVIDLSSVFEPNRLQVAETRSEEEVTPVSFVTETPTGFNRLWKSWRSGYDWGRAVVDR